MGLGLSQYSTGLLFWLYFINTVLLIIHEIDFAYWKDWKLLNLNIGIRGFLIVHLIALPLLLYGLVNVYDLTVIGLSMSLLVSLIGLTAFFIHMRFLNRGHMEFNTGISKYILKSILVTSVLQLLLTIYLIIDNIGNGLI